MRTDELSISLALFLGFASACGSSNYSKGAAATDAGTFGDAPFRCVSSNECPTGWRCNDFGVCERPPPTGDAAVPETPLALGQPISSARFVYVPMTAENKLARIDGATLAVTTTPVGRAPSVVATIPGSDGAVVLDSIDATATIVRPDPGGGADRVTVLATLPNLNRIDIDPSGRFAVAWFDLAKYVAAGGFGGVGSFQDVTIIALASANERAVNLTVGFRPRDVQFDAAGNRAYAITQDGVSVIDLGLVTTQGPRAVPPIPVADPTVPPDDVAVDIVATGEYAVARQLDASALRVVAVGATSPGQAWTIPLASPASAIALAPDGSRVYVVERAAQKLAIANVPQDAIDPTGVVSLDLSDATLGSIALSRDGTRALLYTNATLDPRLTMVALDRTGFPHVTWPLKKAVRVVGVSPTGDTAIVVHAKLPGDPSTATSLDDYIAMSYGYSLVDLSTGFAKLQLVPVDPGPVAYAYDGTKAYVALDGGDAPTATRALQVVAARTGIVTTNALGSPPSAVGILPAASAAFVAQRHPLGRVSFLDLGSDAVRTVTGFDLNSHVVN
jgi:hypothetical protein